MALYTKYTASGEETDASLPLRATNEYVSDMENGGAGGRANQDTKQGPF